MRTLTKLLAISCLSLVTLAGFAADPRPTGNMILKLKAPATETVVRQLQRTLPGTIIGVGPGGVLILVAPKAGVTMEKLKASSPLIAFVDREIGERMTPGFRVAKAVADPQ